MTQGVPFRPTEEQRRVVKAMAGLGVPHEGIASLIDIDAKTLRKYFHAELERGSWEATAKVAQSLFQMATSGQSVAAAIFWMKARAGWREKHDVTITAANEFSQLTDEQLQHILEQSPGWKENRSKTLSGVIEGSASAPAEEDADDDSDGVHHRPTTVGRW